ncbi:MAG TPA: DUF3465 domain-containing protein [Planctomycetes bacterium]|nr:DUF3465 domain-containing protein [Planctomycetota bacterium]
MSPHGRGTSKIKRYGITLVAILLLFAYKKYIRPRITGTAGDSQTQTEVLAEMRSDLAPGAAALEAAAEAGKSGVAVSGEGTVTKILPDDREGARHQRFILLLQSGRTVLVAHNIDLAPRVPIHPGDRVAFQGQYEWNDRGGVVHWTHHDPRGRHRAGWLRHAGRTYK